MEIIGWIGALFFCLCGIPQTIKTWRTHSVKDLSWLFLIGWCLGEIFTLIYVFLQNVFVGYFQLPLLLNYILNFIITTYLVWAKWQYDEYNIEHIIPSHLGRTEEDIIELNQLSNLRLLHEDCNDDKLLTEDRKYGCNYQELKERLK